MNNEDIVTLLFIAIVKKMSETNEKIIVTNEDLKNVVVEGYQVDYSESTPDQFVLKLDKSEDIALKLDELLGED